MDPTAGEFMPQTGFQGLASVPVYLSGRGDNGELQYPTLIPTTHPDKTLPIPSLELYQDIYYPPQLTLRPLLQHNKFPNHDTTSLPNPIGPQRVSAYNLFTLPIQNAAHVQNDQTKLYTRWLHWYIEISDSLLRHICPADLNDLPCPWDELQGGCPLLRLCVSKRKFEHPHLGMYPECIGEERNVCLFIHDVDVTCWSLHEQLVRAPERQFRSYQTCPIIAGQTDERLGDVTSYCKYGHDLEGARVEAWWNYWEHKAQATRCGARGVVTSDRFGGIVRVPLRPKRQTLEGTSQARNLDGSLRGRTWHGDWVTLSCMVGSDRPVDDWVGGDEMVVDWVRGELRPVGLVGRTPESLSTAVADNGGVEGILLEPSALEDADSSNRAMPEIRRCKTI